MNKISSFALAILFVFSLGALAWFGIAPTESLQQTTGSYIDVSTGLDLYLRWTEFIVFLAIIALVVFAVINFKNDVKAALAGLIGIVAVAALLGICFVLSDGQELTRIVNGETEVISETWMKIIDMWCYSIYALVALTVALVIGFPVLRAIKVLK